MPESPSTDRLAQIKARLERDPTSRVFLQLAEEYRRAGRLDEAIGVLQAGLDAHPGYIAARVVLGRTLLETGAAQRAVEELERAVDLDPTQLVANRLLVEAHLAEGRPERARERLELYRLLNDRDDEIARLDERIVELGGPPAAISARHRLERTETTAVPTEEPVREVVVPHVPLRTTGAAATPLAGRPRGDQPFGPIQVPDAALRIVSAIAAGGIFPVRSRASRSIARAASAPPAAIPEATIPGPSRVFSFGQVAVDDAKQAPNVFERPVPASAIPNATPPAADYAGTAEVASPEAPAEALRSTTTLGELYLAQGHLADAEESFSEVLQARPDDGAALRGLEEVRRRRAEAEEAFLDRGEAEREDSSVPSPTAALAGGLTSRKVLLLRDFLNRMRRGSGNHVS